MNNVSLDEEIVKVACMLYEKSGRVEGCDLDNWLEAERIVRARYAIKGENKGKVVESSKKASRRTSTKSLRQYLRKSLLKNYLP